MNHPSRCRHAVMILCWVLLSFPALAQVDDWGDDDDDAGFEEVEAPKNAPVPIGPIRLKGILKYRLGLWLERSRAERVSTSKWSTDLELKGKRGSVRAVFGARLDLDPVYSNGRRGYDRSTQDAYGTRLFGQEMYLGYAPNQWEITVGRQSIAWGEGDVLSPADIVTPYDQREFGLADIDDIRRPRLLSRLSWFSENVRLEFIVGHEAYYGERPTPRSEYSPLRDSLENDPTLVTLLAEKDLDYASEQSGFAPKYWDYFARWIYNGAGLDLGVAVARLRDRQGVFVLPTPTALQNNEIDISLSHLPYYHVSQTGAVPYERWLVKWEVALTYDEPVNVGKLTGTLPDIGRDQMHRLMPMLGVTYSGLSQHTLGVEIQRPLLLTTLTDALYPVEMGVVSGRVVGNYLRERLRVVFVLTAFGLQENFGQLLRSEASYEIRDGFRTSLAYVHYRPPSSDVLGPLSGMGEHDQVLLVARWDFQR